MTKELRELQAKYLAGVETMSLVDAERFLAVLKDAIGSPYRADRIPKLERHIAGIYRTERSDADFENAWRTAAAEYIALTERWLALGASWRCLGALTKWEYGGVEFYRWWSRTNITDNIVEARKADTRLMALIEAGHVDGKGEIE